MIRQFAVECRVDPSPDSLRPVRTQIDAALQRLVPARVAGDIQLVISELCTNAIDAASGDAADVVVRVGLLTPHSGRIEVEDAGPGFGHRHTRSTSCDSDESGRGLRIVRALADEVHVGRTRRGSTVVRALLSWNEALELARDVQ